LTLDDFRPLLPSVAHVHLRDAGRNGWAEVQMPVGAGVVDFRALLAALREVGYDGALSCEYIDTIGNLDIAANLQALKGLLEAVSGEWRNSQR
jgi:sugar phosphate isomerase/epimerase